MSKEVIYQQQLNGDAATEKGEAYSQIPQASPQGGVIMAPVTAPVMINYGGLQLVPVMDPIQEIMNFPEVMINQKFEILEFLTGCQVPNEYIIIGMANGLEKLLFQVNEEASCCCLCYCPGFNRTMNLHLNTVAFTGGTSARTTRDSYHQDCSCGVMCCPKCVRPQMFKLVGGTSPETANGQNIAFRNPWSCCDYVIEVYGDSGEVVYTIRGDCCQCGILCRSTCGRCSDVTFNIYKGTTEEVVGTITKSFKCVSIISDADFYHLTFPPDANAEMRVKLCLANIYLDYCYYENKGERKGCC